MYSNHTLKNGLRIICEKIPYVKSVSVGVWVGAGSRLETEENNGISHFIEHMLFKGTSSRSAQMIAEEMDFIGGHLNAFTSRECTCYYAKVIDAHLETAIDLLADMYINSKLSPEDIELERKVILEEISMYEDSPEDVALDLLASSVWKDSSLGYAVSGRQNSISAIDQISMIDFVDKYYTAKNTVLSVAGNFDEEHLIKLVEKYFGELSSGDRQFTDYGETDFFPIHAFREKDIEQTHLCLGYKGVPNESDEIYAEAVLSNILGGGMSSRLFQKIRETRGLAYSVYTAPESYKGAGMFYVYAALSPDNTNLVRELILQEIEDLKKHGVGEYELARGREQLRGGYIMGLESVSSRMNSMGRAELLTGKPKTPEIILEGINKVDNESIEEIIKKVLGGDYGESIVSAKKKKGQR